MNHVDNDIWNATLRARELMDQGVLPPDTGSAALNPDGVWSISAQLETEIFGLISPGLPAQAVRRATYFARVTNSGLAVDVSGFYAALYALAFFESDIPVLISMALTHLRPRSPAVHIVRNVTRWHRQHPHNWRETRRRIRDAYDTDPEWWASKVNLASTIMALLYGDGDLIETMTIACLAGWDADNNATTSAGLIGIITGYHDLPEAVRSASQLYLNEDVTGGLPRYQTVPEIAARTQALAEAVVSQTGGRVAGGLYSVPSGE